MFLQNMEISIISINFTNSALAVSQRFPHSFTGWTVEQNPSVLQKKETVNFKQNFSDETSEKVSYKQHLYHHIRLGG